MKRNIFLKSMESAFKYPIEFRILNTKAILYFQTLGKCYLVLCLQKQIVFYDGINFQYLKLSEILASELQFSPL